jgi:DNA repair protein RecN (Recombination protein N)
MLVRLSIRNYAIIDELEIGFSNKLNVITGETGAGKSIIMGALGLILGERADSTVLVNKEKKCVVEGIFAVKNKKEINRFLEDNDFDIHEDLVIRREIATNGKSRAFINDTPVTLLQLQSLSSLLVDLHQQFDTLALGESDFQLEVLDALASHSTVIQEYQAVFRRWQLVKKEWQDLQQQKLQLDKEAGYNQFQFDELEDAQFSENELEDIDRELKMLGNAEGIKGVLSKVYFEFQESENPVVQQLKILLNQLQHYAAYHPGLPGLIERLQSSQIELQDIANEVNHIDQLVSYDPKKIEQLNERLSTGYKLLKKHGVQTTHELLQLQKQLKEKLEAVQNMDETLRQKEKESNQLLEEVQQWAARISAGRNRQVKTLEEKVNKLLVQVGMPHAKLKVEIKSTELNVYGNDAVEFLFNGNLPAGQESKNAPFQAVRKVASGGELSRLMLCIKSLVAQSIDLPTMIFDEIDTGISGEAARQVSLIMKELAVKRQVICITHQPQIAGKATAHFFVYKTIDKDKVKTNIRQLNTDERISVIAKMLSGEKPTAAAMENAREMLMN